MSENNELEKLASALSSRLLQRDGNRKDKILDAFDKVRQQVLNEVQEYLGEKIPADCRCGNMSYSDVLDALAKLRETRT